MLSKYEKALARARRIELATNRFRVLQGEFGTLTPEIIKKEEATDPVIRAMVLSILTNGGVDFPNTGE